MAKIEISVDSDVEKIYSVLDELLKIHFEQTQDKIKAQEEVNKEVISNLTPYFDMDEINI
jgi:hypothetical protein